MKKTLLTLAFFVGAAALVAFSSPAFAAVSGQCSGCHTMHNSQGGTAMATGGPHSTLLLNNCLGCHTTTGTDPYVGVYPYVAGSSFSDDNCLAGGLFPASMGSGDNDDNHHGIGNTNAPAGYAGTFYTGGTNGLACAGSNGCHGNESDVDDMTAISGGHHSGTGAYRMLFVGGTASTNAVGGDPADDYEELIIKTPSTSPTYGTNANLYSGGSMSGGKTINDLCAKCHGDFHGTANTQSGGAWIRHPTDNSISTDWTLGAGGYSLDGDDIKNNPVGFVDASVDNAAKKVLCLSCHRAHGTENDDLLRWAYSTQDAGSGITYGCLGCHNAQR